MSKSTTVRIPTEQYEELKEISTETDVPIVALLRRAISGYLGRRELAKIMGTDPDKPRYELEEAQKQDEG